MTELDLKLQDLKNAFNSLKEENKRLKFSNSVLEKELQEYRRLEISIHAPAKGATAKTDKIFLYSLGAFYPFCLI